MKDEYPTGFYQSKSSGRLAYFENQGEKILVSCPQFLKDELANKKDWYFLSSFEPLQNPEQEIENRRKDLDWAESKLVELANSKKNALQKSV